MATTDTFIEEMCDDLVTASIATTKGTDIFCDRLPDTGETTAICLKQTGGTPNAHSPHPTYTVQCLVRATSAETALQTAAKVYNRFHSVTGYSLTNFTINSALALQMPSSILEDERRRHVVSFNLAVTLYADAQASGATGHGGSKDVNIPT